MANFLSGLLRAISSRELDPYGIPHFLPWPEGQAPTLVVFAHEWGGTGASRWRLKRTLWGQSGDKNELAISEDEGRLTPNLREAPLGPVDFLAPRYVHNPLSNADPKRVALEFQKAIHNQVKGREEAGNPYRSIVLVGYSAGSIILRKAMVWGLGQDQDHWDRELGQNWHWNWALTEDGAQMSGMISRIVLIAGINRGWSLESRPKDMSRSLYVAYKLLEFLARPGPFGRFILALERGEPFISNLRLQWLRLADRLGGLPTTIQLMGTIDDIVSRDDNRDVLALGDSHVLLVEYADHNGIMQLHDPKHGAYFRRRLDQALKGEIERDDIAETEAQRVRNGHLTSLETVTGMRSKQDEPISMIVLPVHGIRDNHDWCNHFRHKLQRSLTSGRALCPSTSYGHLSILRFLLFPTRRRVVRWFVDLYTESVASVGDPTIPVHFVGHSNGTYLLARAMLDYEAVVIDRAVLTGSVVRRNFPWNDLRNQNRIGYLRNERAATDLIVGVFPGFYQQLSNLLPGSHSILDIGNGGLWGFDDPPVGQDVERFYLDGGHGAGVREQNLQHLVDFVLDRPEKEREFVPQVPTWAKLLSNLAWLVWLVILGVIVALLTALPPFWNLALILALLLIIATV